MTDTSSIPQEISAEEISRLKYEEAQKIEQQNRMTKSPTIAEQVRQAVPHLNRAARRAMTAQARKQLDKAKSSV